MYRLLIVDSDPKICEQIKTLLDWSAYGFDGIMAAQSYPEAVNLALDRKPHVTLIGTQLGAHSGCELAENLRAIGLKTSVCMIAENMEPELVLAAMRSGAQDFLIKPLAAEDMQRFLERVVVYDLNGMLLESYTFRNEVDPVLKVPYSSLSKITNKILLVVKSSYRSPLTLTNIAETFQMSSKYIGRVFLKDTGIKFSEYLMAYRMLEAKKLIVSTREKISVIANMVGYVQQNNFYIHFKSYFGVSPSALRNCEALPESGDVQGENYEKSVQPR